MFLLWLQTVAIKPQIGGFYDPLRAIFDPNNIIVMILSCISPHMPQNGVHNCYNLHVLIHCSLFGTFAQISCSKLGSGVLTTWSVHSGVNTTFNFCANQ